MKGKSLILFLLLIHLAYLTHESFAQGGFGGINYKAEYSPNGGIMLFGGGGAWVINENFYLGGAGFGSVNSLTVQNETLSSLGYGGLRVGYFNQLNNGPIRLGGDVLLGSGGYKHGAESHELFLMEPSFNFWYRINHFMQLSIGMYYRLAFMGANSPVTAANLSNPGISVNLYFGSF